MTRGMRKLATRASKMKQTSSKIKDAGAESSKNGAPATVNKGKKLASPTKAKGKQCKRTQINVSEQDNNILEVNAETPAKKAKTKALNQLSAKTKTRSSKEKSKTKNVSSAEFEENNNFISMEVGGLSDHFPSKPEEGEADDQ